MLVTTAASAQAIPPDEPFRYSDVRLGALVHDFQFDGGKEQSVDINIEYTSPSPVSSDWTGGLPLWAQFLVHPRLHVGVSPNLAGRTNQAYAGVTWTALLARDMLRPGDGLEVSVLFGPEINDGQHHASDSRHKSLGSNVLFHEALDISYRITPSWLVGAYVEHSSNAGFARANAGLTDVGFRVGYRF